MAESSAQGSFRLDEAERATLARDGFVVRREVFSADELRDHGEACEALIRLLLEAKRKTKWEVGAYVFEMQRRLETVVKWEMEERDAVQGVEPFAHLSEPLHRLALDPRFVEPMKDVIGTERIELFTEKLNLKRGHVGGPIVLHQDYPYWVDVAENAAEVGTAMLFVDDAPLRSGALEVVPGSHREGEQARRQVEGFGSFEMDPGRYDESRLVALELAAGSVVFFGPFLVHRSLPNRTDADRRALLYSYQPAGRRHMRDATYRMNRAS
jgi:ectoine hydroxylase